MATQKAENIFHDNGRFYFISKSIFVIFLELKIEICLFDFFQQNQEGFKNRFEINFENSKSGQKRQNGLKRRMSDPKWFKDIKRHLSL